MRTRVDERLRDEARRFRLAFTCQACAHYVVESSACAHGYPNAAHLCDGLEREESVEFCKEFELV